MGRRSRVYSVTAGRHRFSVPSDCGCRYIDAGTSEADVLLLFVYRITCCPAVLLVCCSVGTVSQCSLYVRAPTV